MKRLHYVDQLRAFAIFLIIFEHNDHDSWLSAFSTSFSVPLFFIISGFVGGGKENVGLKTYLKKQFKRLIIPYLSISVVLYVFWFFVGRHYGESAAKAYDPIKNLVGIIYAQGGPDFMNWGIPMWFLPALFVVGVIDFFVFKITHKGRFLAAILIPVTGWMLYYVFGLHFPWSFDVAMAVYGFYFLGVIIRKYNIAERTLKYHTLVPLVIVLLFAHVLSANLNGRVLYYYSSYGNFFPLMYLNGFLGFAWVFLLFRHLPKINAFSWVGKNTLPLLGFHLLAMTFIKGFALFVLGVEIDFAAWNSLLFALLQIALLVPVILFLNRYLPFMVGNLGRKGSAAY